MQHLYLQAMGIQVWQPRPAELLQVPALAGMILDLLNDQQICVAYLLTTTPPDTWEATSLKLLDAMLAAIQLQRSSKAAYTYSLLTDKQPKPILLIGEKLAQSFLRTPLRIVNLRARLHYPQLYPQFATLPTFTIEEVLADPKLKRWVWEDLRLFKDAL